MNSWTAAHIAVHVMSLKLIRVQFQQQVPEPIMCDAEALCSKHVWMDDEKLIEAVKKLPSSWKVANKSYKHLQTKENVWESGKWGNT